MTDLLDTDPDRNIPFPDCAGQCAALNILGVGECESICPWKFDATGRPLTIEELQS